MGDFNCVENDMDSSPLHKDDEKVTASLQEMIVKSKLVYV